ncbi:unnamed protein product [Caenorhabditis sp. 36 PRJEB53466]|nr:unnamed protein product [Caenorhabditis sp. 36 PRJEB53466]
MDSWNTDSQQARWRKDKISRDIVIKNLRSYSDIVNRIADEMAAENVPEGDQVSEEIIANALYSHFKMLQRISNMSLPPSPRMPMAPIKRMMVVEKHPNNGSSSMQSMLPMKQARIVLPGSIPSSPCMLMERVECPRNVATPTSVPRNRMTPVGHWSPLQFFLVGPEFSGDRQASIFAVAEALTEIGITMNAYDVMIPNTKVQPSFSKAPCLGRIGFSVTEQRVGGILKLFGDKDLIQMKNHRRKALTADNNSILTRELVEGDFLKMVVLRIASPLIVEAYPRFAQYCAEYTKNDISFKRPGMKTERFWVEELIVNHPNIFNKSLAGLDQIGSMMMGMYSADLRAKEKAKKLLEGCGDSGILEMTIKAGVA